MAESLAQSFVALNYGGAQGEQEPIRGELYSAERLEQYASELSIEHRISAGPKRGKPLLPRLEENSRKLSAAYRVLAEAIRQERSISPAAEWLVDNFHIVQEQLREIRADLPRSYYYELPKLEAGDLAGYPRIYAVALALIAHTDSRLEIEIMKRFIRAYQSGLSGGALSTGELWAFAISLRLAMVENLRRIAARTIAARAAREAADTLADEVLEVAGKQPDELRRVVAEPLRKRRSIDPAFVAQLTRRLRDQDPLAGVALKQLEQRLQREGCSTEQLVQQEHQRQAAAQITVANVITSMRLLSTLDWRDFFESVSLVDSALARDPAGAYALMDFPTRDSYRHVIERISKQTRASELDIARHTVKLSAAAQGENPQDERRAHVGYYLIDRGLAELEDAFACSPRFSERLRRVVLRHPTMTYLGSLSLLTAVILAAIGGYAFYVGAGPLALTGLTALGLVPASELALSTVNWAITSVFKPRVLPKIDTSHGIPEEGRTMVVIPTMLANEAVVRELLERIEVHFLANQDEQVFFGLLGDLPDAPCEAMPDDEKLVGLARDRVAELNARYTAEGQPPRFHLFSRGRQWNPSEGKWICWERKRGNLHEFNRWLRGARDTSFAVSPDDQESLKGIRYIITLDADTQLPRDTVRRLVGTIRHPLNRARFDEPTGRVNEGYGILQPRVQVSPTSAAQSGFAHIFSGNTGVDPYTTAVSDVYQDLFGEGIYTGKGLYEVDSFEAALVSRVPENTMLSHDLFEGLFARTALVTDIELLDDYPSNYVAYAKRLHRWTRGDWQIAPWLLPRIPDAQGGQTRNTLPLIARWKILDNLRRSLVAPTVLLLLVAAWTVLPGSAAWWTLFILLAIAFPVFAPVTASVLRPPRGIEWRSHASSILHETRIRLTQGALTIVFLAHQAYLMADAVLRTLFRQFVSHRHLLEWVTAADTGRNVPSRLTDFLRFMWPAELIAGVVAALILLFRPDAWLVAAPFLLAWISSPVIADLTSRRQSTEDQTLTEEERQSLRLLARRTWRYFETFVGETDHWLSPDNFQEDPRPIVAHRMSPTNTGLLLLSTVSAHDFGYIGTLELVERLELTFTSLVKLSRFRGHFFNWYDTRTLEPLTPQYVSTVDSGNLAGHLIAIKQACLELPNSQLFGLRVKQGLADTIMLLQKEAARLSAFRERTPGLSIKQLREEIEACASLIAVEPPETLIAWSELLKTIVQHVAVIDDMERALAQEHGDDSFTELRFWIAALTHQAQAHQRDLNTLLPWSDARTKKLEQTIGQCSVEAAAQCQKIKATLADSLVVSQIPAQCDAAREPLAAMRAQIEQCPMADSQRKRTIDDLTAFASAIERTAEAANTLMARARNLTALCERLAEEMDFGFLFDEERKVLTIGYNVTSGQRDNSFYDLLASEARLASFVAIATGDVGQEHWFRLSRPLTAVNGHRALISWSGTMFEYLMPLLVMQNYAGTLLDQTYRAVIARQVEYGKEHNIPWGVSESAFDARDLQLNYQYGPFGVPGLGLKRGLSEDLVVSPYATLLAALIAPRAALENIRHLEREGALDRYGFYEAIDYTPERLPKQQKRAIIRAFLTHHQGMSLVALDNVLNEQIMQRRFHADPVVQATELLLQERIPHGVAIMHPRPEEVLDGRPARVLATPVTRRYEVVDLLTPRTQLLSNGTYTVMITTGGAGYSKCGDLAVTRWREDPTRDHCGSFCYLRDVRSGAVWSAGYQPTGRDPQDYEATFSEEKVEIRRHDVGVLTHMEVVVSPEDNAEVRRLSITNQSSREREIELTSYAEVVLAPPASDAAHPAFSNLFIETEFISAEVALLAHRRPRSATDEQVWGVHVIATEGETIGASQYETDRGRFLGRGRNTAEPIAVMDDRPLSGTVGAVLDPIFCLRQRVRIQPNETVHVSFATAVAHSREEALVLADKYHEPSAFERVARLAWTRSQVELRHLNLDAEEAELFQRLAGRLLYSDPSLRPRSHLLALNTKAQSGLWPYGISGDLPILLARISDELDLHIVWQLLRGHEFLRQKGVTFDLVILNEHPASYAQSLQDELLRLVRKSGSTALLDKPGGIFLPRADLMPEDDLVLVQTAARVYLVTERGSLEDQLSYKSGENELPPPFIPSFPLHPEPGPSLVIPELSFFNGLGGFSQEGHEYVTVLGEGQWTPAPWLNVIANAQDFGFQVSETGAGYTWSVNSGENRLTPWSNDAISDPPGEVIYLRDEDTGATWTPTPLPIREAGPYMIKHGQGYTVFEHASHGILAQLRLFVPVDAPVKISLLRLHNQTDRKRRLSVTSYNELVLGVRRERSAPFVITEVDTVTGAVFARNPWNNEFADRIAFAEISAKDRSITCDRKEFLGRGGSVARPAALRRTRLSGRVGAGFDPCAALQTVFDLEPGEMRQIVVLLGEGENAEAARAMVERFRPLLAVNDAFERVRAYWGETLSAVEVRTPDPAMDIMMNRWLLYQTLSCRMWARSAFYQSSGAYGFRDQLQDVMALSYAQPAYAREQILRAAAHQFKEGDVQHWWHPPTGRGVRTRSSDDLLWLPYVTSFYVNVTGDVAVLDEKVSFIEAPPLAPGDEAAYTQPAISAETGSVYEHCARALDRSLEVGAHGLPLMGTGDWNDGMNRVGHQGRGESVWLGWFLHTALAGFLEFCDAREQEGRGRRYREHMEKLKGALEEYGWDGDWYRRAYFDDGTPLGSAQNDECRIDAIAQSWGVISGAADTQRARRALAAVEEYLIRRGDGLVLLFTPPFVRGTLDPGYIKGYVPGVRENGGQYTHAALWTLIAYARLGEGDRAGELAALLNPINHASTRAGLHKYRIEPYVVAGDVYAVMPHTGRGGWSWYTGSASWMYRAVLESMLGFQLRGARLRIEPCIPRSWREYEISYRHGSTLYHISVENPQGVCQGVAAIELDGEPQAAAEITLDDDGKTHQVRLILGENIPPPANTRAR